MNTTPKVNELLVYRKRREPALGLLLSLSENKYSIFAEDGKEHSVDIKKVVLNSGIVFADNQNNSEKKLFLRNLRKSLEIAKDNIDLKTIWQCLEDSTAPVNFNEFLELYEGDSKLSEEERLDFFWAVDKNTIYFSRTDNGYLPNTKEQIDKKLKSIKAKEEKARKREQALEWINSVLKENKEPDLSSIDKDFLVLIESYLIDLDRYERAKEAKEFLHDIGLKSIEAAVQFLIRIGFWNKDDDPVSKKYLNSEFSKRSLNEVETIIATNHLTSDFVDRTDLHVFSVDDKETADIDDALSIEIDEGVITLGVHISNVAHFIPREGFLDIESQNRGETVYFPEKVENMFPDELVNNLLTLSAGEDKLTFSLYAKFKSDDFELLDYSFEQSIVRVSENLTYEKAESVFNETDWGKVLVELTNHLRDKRLNNGAFVVQLPELKIMVDEEKNISIKKNYMTSMPHKVVSECMVLMNMLSARFSDENNIPSLYRTQMQEIDEEARTLDTEDNIFPTKVIRYLKPTRVNLECKPHKSLGIDSYIQITSPIRRYMDVVLQRQLISFLNNGDISYSSDELDSMHTKVSLNVREIKNSQKSRNRYWLLKYFIENNIKSSFGYVNIKNDGKPYVYIPDYLVDLPLSNYGNNKYSNGQYLNLEFSNIDPLRRTIIVKPVLEN